MSVFYEILSVSLLGGNYSVEEANETSVYYSTQIDEMPMNGMFIYRFAHSN